MKRDRGFGRGWKIRLSRRVSVGLGLVGGGGGLVGSELLVDVCSERSLSLHLSKKKGEGEEERLSEVLKRSKSEGRRDGGGASWVGWKSGRRGGRRGN